MAEAATPPITTTDDNTTNNSNVHFVTLHPECSVCLEACDQPILLPCSHIFCFLCAKGFVVRTNNNNNNNSHDNGNCALCRRAVPEYYFLNPVVVRVNEGEEKTIDGTVGLPTVETFEWFYEGRNGWWKYDTNTTLVLEETFNNNNNNNNNNNTEDITSCEILISAFIYVVDFQKMIQYQKNDPTRCRRVKRDACGVTCKGVAGLRSKPLDTLVCCSCKKPYTTDEDISVDRCLDCICDTTATHSDAVEQESKKKKRSRKTKRKKGPFPSKKSRKSS